MCVVFEIWCHKWLLISQVLWVLDWPWTAYLLIYFKCCCSFALLLTIPFTWYQIRLSSTINKEKNQTVTHVTNFWSHTWRSFSCYISKTIAIRWTKFVFSESYRWGTGHKDCFCLITLHTSQSFSNAFHFLIFLIRVPSHTWQNV